MTFKNDESITCDYCSQQIYAGQDYILFQNDTFCNEDCLGMHLIDRVDYKVLHLETAEEKADNYADIITHEGR